MSENKSNVRVDKIIHELKHFLPAQAPLKDFIHHNTLHAFQHEQFHDALVKANRIFGFKTYLRLNEYRKLYEQQQIHPGILDRIILEKKGAENRNDFYKQLFEASDISYFSPRIGNLRACWKEKYAIDLDAIVHPFLFRLLGSYLDQGVSMWNFPGNSSGFFKAVRDLQKNSYGGIFKSDRVIKLLFSPKLELEKLLKILVGKENLFEHYLFDQQFAHPGWSGMVSVIEETPHCLLDEKAITLIDLIKIELLMEIDALDQHFGEIWSPLARVVHSDYVDLFSQVKKSKNDPLKEIWQEAFEWTYYDQVLSALQINQLETKVTTDKKFQAIFCIDDRECSFRRHVEEIESQSETFGTAGHFNIEFYFQPENGKFYTKVCPAPVTPKFLIKELKGKGKKKRDWHFNKSSHSLFFGWILTHTIGLWSGIRMAISIFKPRMNAATSVSGMHMDPDSSLTIEHQESEQVDGLQLGFTLDEMADRVEGLLKSIGLVHDFAPLIYIIGHGSTSVNNTHYAGYDCGACSGRQGSVNARVAAYMANHPGVRKRLIEKGIDIPETSQFIGGLHDTSRDEIFFFDTEVLHEENSRQHLKNVQSFRSALRQNAKERSRRFASINTKAAPEKIHQAVKTRSVSLFEPRPELNHATNALAIVGRRDFTKHVFLDRRSFLNSYDYQIDPEGNYLLNILNAVAPVCGGINLEYYFSRVDNYNLGAGTKLPHNVVGLFGVANGTDGDLRTGLPWQMVEVHDPVRLMVIVEHFPEIVLKVIQKNPATYNWFEKNWVKLVACNPLTREFYIFEQGLFKSYTTMSESVDLQVNLEKIFEENMDNLPVYKI